MKLQRLKLLHVVVSHVCTVFGSSEDLFVMLLRCVGIDDAESCAQYRDQQQQQQQQQQASHQRGGR